MKLYSGTDLHSNNTYCPKSTASVYEGGCEKVGSAVYHRRCSGKDVRSQSERVLLSRACLNVSAFKF